ncbi:MAG: hypothetical protein COA43_05635 [Robiginitomaculum sp.]|nr:MAG: hypothetical protein COA43_05635 [Robiginitomaculum sp.]
MNVKIISLLALTVSLSACSTIVNGSNQELHFDTASVEGADCVLTGGSKQSVDESFTTPAVVTVPRSKKPLKARCTMNGYHAGTKTITSTYEAATAGNLLLGGFIGAGVDAATGALYKYPEAISIKMKPLNSGATINEIVR